MSLPTKAVITEVCPRDGFQSAPFIPTEEKVNIINELMLCGFSQMEVSSFVHPKAVPQLKDATEVLKNIKRKEGVKLRALIPNEKGMERALEAKVDKVKLMLSATDSHSLHNANAKTFAAMEKFKPIVNMAEGTDTTVSGSISVAFGCPYEGEVPIQRHIEICEYYDSIGIKDISLADTTGMGHPVNVRKILKALISRFPHFHFSLHLHNTRGMAFANAVTGLEEGIIDFDSSAAGLGGCPYAPNASGNISTEDLVHGFEEMGVETGIDLDKLIKVSKKLQRMFPNHAESFLLNAGKSSDLKIAPKKQEKVGER
ncbi:hydroxymethylglutaryl-CoA lyase [Bacillus sp. FJAT-44742]|uniref:hydroxymethylglutaryl-CoA lyase n=1 Tax=Bacillus sp. FJAT-44742 TaxID=2014005 RepID=UPI000C248B32|nr:hydroxymethylglutaryl-CoA lyase [Bacillus sp. FJAT-44742]